MRWELDFSRFANLGRKNSGMADFDLDISQNKRGLFIELVKEKYGKDFVVPIEKVNKIYNKIENKNKKIIVIKNGIHWFLSSKEVETVLGDIKEFIRS